MASENYATVLYIVFFLFSFDYGTSYTTVGCAMAVSPGDAWHSDEPALADSPSPLIYIDTEDRNKYLVETSAYLLHFMRPFLR